MNRRVTIALAVLGAAFAFGLVAYFLFIAVDGAPVETFKTVSASMEPTLLRGDWFTISPRFTGVPYRGQLVGHNWPPDPSKRFVKRIVALPGDTVAMTRGTLLIGNRPVAEPYAWHEEGELDPITDDFRWQRAYVLDRLRDTVQYVASRNNWGPIVVPADNYFVLGDNRDNSLDSRYWGFLPRSDILGEVRRIYFSRDSSGHVRWSRFGRRPH